MGDWMNGNPQEQQAIRRFLRAYADRAGDARGMGGLLEALCAYYDADRVRILTADAQHTQLGTALVRCREGAAPGEPFALALDGPLPGPEEEILIPSVEARFAPGSPTGGALAAQGVHSVMAEPLERDGAVYGFVAVENPRRHAGGLLLSVAASAYLGRSAGLPAAQDPSRIIRSLGRIYTSLYCIDLTDGTFAELSSVSVIHSHIGARGDAQERLNYFCHHLVAPEGRGDMLAFVDLSTLDGRLGDGRIISRQYRSTLFAAPEGEGALSWRECSFIECGRDGAGRLTHVIFATKSIHETKARELEAQQRLQETNRELTALLAAQTQHTAIIGAMCTPRSTTSICGRTPFRRSFPSTGCITRWARRAMPARRCAI